MSKRCRVGLSARRRVGVSVAQAADIDALVAIRLIEVYVTTADFTSGV